MFSVRVGFIMLNGITFLNSFIRGITISNKMAIFIVFLIFLVILLQFQFIFNGQKFIFKISLAKLKKYRVKLYIYIYIYIKKKATYPHLLYHYMGSLVSVVNETKLTYNEYIFKLIFKSVYIVIHYLEITI